MQLLCDSLIIVIGAHDLVIPDKLVSFLLNFLADRCATKEQKQLSMEIISRCINKLEDQIQSVSQWCFELGVDLWALFAFCKINLYGNVKYARMHNLIIFNNNINFSYVCMIGVYSSFIPKKHSLTPPKTNLFILQL